MARPKLTPMQFMRKYCKHEPGFSLPEEEEGSKVPSAHMVIASAPVHVAKAKVA